MMTTMFIIPYDVSKKRVDVCPIFQRWKDEVKPGIKECVRNIPDIDDSRDIDERPQWPSALADYLQQHAEDCKACKTKAAVAATDIRNECIPRLEEIQLRAAHAADLLVLGGKKVYMTCDFKATVARMIENKRIPIHT